VDGERRQHTHGRGYLQLCRLRPHMEGDNGGRSRGHRSARLRGPGRRILRALRWQNGGLCGGYQLHLRAARAQPHSYAESHCPADSHQDCADTYRHSHPHTHPHPHPCSDPSSHACQYALPSADPTLPYPARWLVWPQPVACARRFGQSLRYGCQAIVFRIGLR